MATGWIICLGEINDFIWVAMPAQACSGPTLVFEKTVQKNCLGFNMTLHHFTLVTSLREWIFSGSH